MKFLTLLVLPLIFASHVSAQQTTPGDDFRTVLHDSYSVTATDTPIGLSSDGPAMASGEKSRFLGVVYSLLLPGMGELYAGAFERGHIPLIAEGFLWLGYAWFQSYGSWIQDGSRTFAAQHAGANFDGKEDGYRVDIENFNDIYAYNEAKLIQRDLNALYPVETSAGYFWKWDNAQNRHTYEQMRIRSDRMFNATSFVVLGMIANRIWSAVKASLAVRDHNAKLQTRQMGVLPDVRTRVTTLNGSADGLEIQFRQRF